MSTLAMPSSGLHLDVGTTPARLSQGRVLVSHALCPYVQRAVILLAEQAVPFDRIDIDLAAKPDWFLRLSPTGATPRLTPSTSSSTDRRPTPSLKAQPDASKRPATCAFGSGESTHDKAGATQAPRGAGKRT